jgi:hypothetical protein
MGSAAQRPGMFGASRLNSQQMPNLSNVQTGMSSNLGTAPPLAPPSPSTNPGIITDMIGQAPSNTGGYTGLGSGAGSITNPSDMIGTGASPLTIPTPQQPTVVNQPSGTIPARPKRVITSPKRRPAKPITNTIGALPKFNLF